ncbi:ImmA/IrrE family metallo-endopeptidase [Bradyrhizobium oligotrophicum]|uniref:ImmA/IrrE family metallo-endopeptidase n=1 Tax=Bradyrhizobium oligotrophicum TaxID=44255 RepID=UPI003EB7E897
MTVEADWASAPGETIQRIMALREISSEELADGLGLGDDEFQALIIGEVRVTLTIAERLAQNLGSSPRFWLARDKSYVRERARLGIVGPADENAWANTMPVRSMKRYGWLPPMVRGAALQSHLLSFFDCGSLREWGVRYSSGVGEVAFKASLAFPADGMATLVWLRVGEKQAEHLKLGRYDQNLFRSTLPSLKRLSAFKHPEVFLGRLRSACGAAGVAVTTSRAPEGCRASGASWFGRGGNPVIHLSFRHLSEDHFWFTFFHEAAHILLHGESHIDGESVGDLAFDQAEQEAEADMFARDVLVPPNVRARLIEGRPTRSTVIASAREAGVTPGIVVGQLENAGVLAHGQLSFLKRRYRWDDSPYVPVMRG